LLFILLDHVEESHDKRISDHVLRVHRYRGIEEADALGEDDVPAQEQDSGEPTVMYDKFDKHLHGSKGTKKKGKKVHLFGDFL
jgi:DNA replication licensing factor MCM3